PELWPSVIVRAHRAAQRTIDRITYDEIRKRRSRPGETGDMLSLLVAATYPDGSRMDDAAVRDEAVTLMSTGYETIGGALSWTWYLLARHPDAAARMRNEIADVVGNRFPRPDDAAGLRYTRMVLAEAMRLYPPTWIFVRVARDDDTLPSGARIPRGGKIY